MIRYRCNYCGLLHTVEHTLYACPHCADKNLTRLRRDDVAAAPNIYPDWQEEPAKETPKAADSPFEETKEEPGKSDEDEMAEYLQNLFLGSSYD